MKYLFVFLLCFSSCVHDYVNAKDYDFSKYNGKTILKMVCEYNTLTIYFTNGTQLTLRSNGSAILLEK